MYVVMDFANKIIVSLIHHKNHCLIVREKSKTGFYAAVLGGTACIFGIFHPSVTILAPLYDYLPDMYMFIGYVGYTLFKDLIHPSGSYKILEAAIQRLEENPDVISLLDITPGQSFASVHGIGHGNRAIRRRPMFHEQMGDDGSRILDAVFCVEGPSKQAKVTLRTVEVSS